MLRDPGFRLFLIAALLVVLIAVLGPVFGLLGCESFSELSFGSCKVGEEWP